MSNFWDLNDDVIDDQTGEFDAGGGKFEPIPEGTQLLTVITGAEWGSTKKDPDDKFIDISWKALKPEAYANRVIFHKIRVMDKDGKKADKAKKMLAAIDANAGGKLRTLNDRPTDKHLAAALLGKQMIIQVRVWELEDQFTGEQLTGNWVSAVAPKSKGLPEKEQKPVDDIESLDIPF